MRTVLFKRDLMEAPERQEDPQGYAAPDDGGDLLSSLYDVTGAPQNWMRFLGHVTPLLHGNVATIATFASGDEADHLHAFHLQADESAQSADTDSGAGGRVPPTENSMRSALPVGTLQHLLTLETPSVTAISIDQPCLFHDLGMTQALIGLCSRHDGALRYIAVGRQHEPGFSITDEFQLQPLLPHIARSLHLHLLIDRLSAGVNTAATLLDRLPLGIIFFDEHATCLSMNENARRAVNEARSLLRHMQTYILSRAKTARLAGKGTRPHVLSLPPNMGEQHYFLLTWDILAEGQDRVHTVFFILNPDQKVQIDDQALCRLFRLTAAEARVAGLIANGTHLDDIAEQLDVSLNTVRTHLRHIFEKTGVERQADLVHLLLRALVAIRAP
ncbi:MAG: LuxR family transcriptional regulator [Rhodospirillaceae bacterium]|nr:MAG: LuxR family transcriptional regulator [Rhodospirillaceae bacterium]